MITEDQVITYLANIIKISQLDGKLDSGEQAAIEQICERLKAEENQLQEAIKKVAEGRHTMMPVGRLSDKIRNLEDMLYVAMSDGELTASEKAEMLAYVKKINISQNQIKIVLNETKTKIELQKIKLTCTACDNPLSPESKFCTECGAKV